MKKKILLILGLFVVIAGSFTLCAQDGRKASKNFSHIPDGKYQGEHADFGGSKLIVEVTLKEGRIHSINIIQDNGDDYARNARKVIKDIIREQSLEVDAVSGATVTSGAIIGAVKDAIEE